MAQDRGLAIAFEHPVDLRPFAREGFEYSQPLIAEVQIVLKEDGISSPWRVVQGVTLYGIDNVHVDRDGVIAYHDADPGLLGHSYGLALMLHQAAGRVTEVAQAVRVVLHADMLVDPKGRPLDGHFIGGRLPTSGDTPGGIFVSWLNLK